jgi:hypothetical protein
MYPDVILVPSYRDALKQQAMYFAGISAILAVLFAALVIPMLRCLVEADQN